MKSKDAPFNEWLETGPDTFCPVCKSTSIQVMQTFTVLGVANLAGLGLKYSAVTRWIYRCPECGAEGKSEPKPGSLSHGESE